MIVLAKYDDIYLALLEKKDPPNWNDFLTHCRSEIILKLKGYGYYQLAIDKYLVDDILQDTMLAICKSLQRYDKEKGTFKNYVDGIILNLIKNYIKLFTNSKEQLCREDFNQSFDNHIESSGVALSPEKEFIIKEKIERLYKVMRYELSDYEYRVLECRILFELSTEETMERLGITKEKISRTLNKAKEKLKGQKKNLK